jgi:hypothetical protein
MRTGRWLDYGDRASARDPMPHNNLLVSILNAFDVPASSFGNPEYCTGPLPGLI